MKRSLFIIIIFAVHIHNNTHPVPLNEEAIEIIRRQSGKHFEFVFTYKGKPIKRCNTPAWRKALKRAGIEDFRWHDLRHTWASWHVQNGTSLYELQKPGRWPSLDMVNRYAHFNSDYLRKAADHLVVGTNLVHGAYTSPSGDN
jgi:integrase